jgi:glycosyltransferase involved in cell wall biosynthesis
MAQTIAVIIPVYNEERTLSSVIEVVRTWGKASEVIVVNDGSTDGTIHAIQRFGNSIDVISYRKNRGKSYAMAKAIEKTKCEIIVFMDGDVVGLTHMDLDILVAPVLSGKAEMVMGAARFWSAGNFEPFNDITGERVILRKNIAGKLKEIKPLGYGIELYLNDLHRNKPVVTVRLPYVFIIGKLGKMSISNAAMSYLVEAKDLMAQVVRQSAGDLTPQAKRVITGVQRYLKLALEQLQ